MGRVAVTLPVRLHIWCLAYVGSECKHRMVAFLGTVQLVVGATSHRVLLPTQVACLLVVYLYCFWSTLLSFRRVASGSTLCLPCCVADTA